MESVPISAPQSVSVVGHRMQGPLSWIIPAICVPSTHHLLPSVTTSHGHEVRYRVFFCGWTVLCLWHVGTHSVICTNILAEPNHKKKDREPQSRLARCR